MQVLHIISGVIIIYLFTALYSIFLHPLKKVPGPFLAKFSEFWRTLRYFRGTWHEDILEVHRRYGPVVRISPNEVSIVDKEGLAKTFGHTSGTRKTNWYDTWTVPGAGTSLFFATDPKEHAFLRKRISSAYAMSSILAVEAEVQIVADSLWACLHRFAKEGKPADMHFWASYFAFDVVGKLGLGGPIGFINEGVDVNGIIASIHAGFYFMSNLGFVFGQTRLINNQFSESLLKLLNGGKPNSFTTFQLWMKDQVLARLAEEPTKKRNPDLLDHFIAMKEPNGEPASLGSVLIEGGNLIGAGADTTSVGIRSVLGQLLLHPSDLKRLQAEIDEAYSLHGFSDEPGKGITYQAAKDLPFLSACVKEGLRLHPSILYQLPRESLPSALTIAGYEIPPSATVSMSPLAQNRCQEVYGKDADEWKPTRWLKEGGLSSEQLKDMEKYNVTFGYGSRTCIGRNLALVEIHKFIGQLLHQFDCELMNKKRPWITKSQWFSYQAEMWMKFSERIKA